MCLLFSIHNSKHWSFTTEYMSVCDDACDFVELRDAKWCPMSARFLQLIKKKSGPYLL